MIKQFYYWMYKGLQKIRKDKDPAFDAFLGMVFFQNLNLIVVTRIIHNITGFTLLKGEVVQYGTLLGITLLGLNYFGLYSKRKQIFDHINTLSVYRYKKGKKIFITYVILSFIMFFSLGLFK